MARISAWRSSRDRRGERAPGAALFAEHAATGGGQPAIAAPSLARLLHAAALNPAAFLEPIQERIQRRGAERHGSAGSLLDRLADLVAMPRACRQLRERIRSSALPSSAHGSGFVGAWPVSDSYIATRYIE